MTQSVELPLWILILILLFAGVTFASHFLFPSVRWFFRKRAERVVARLNERLKRPIEPFKLARRYDTVQRLTYDAEVLQAVSERAKETGVREDVVLEEARDYAREIVPSFSASVYFGLGTRIAKWLSRMLYRVRIVRTEEPDADMPEDATLIYVINHRSNMDYVLLTYLAAGTTALSFAMGEWARALPARPFLRAIGGYFIRRRAGNTLYRKVLARYVQIATAEGLTQAIFPEGRLSLDGAPQKPKYGLLSYVYQAAVDRHGYFVPVSVNYDRVLEDRVLLAAGTKGNRRFRVGFWGALSHGLKLLTRRFHDKDYRFGHAAVVFGAPVSLADMKLEEGALGETPAEVLAKELMTRVNQSVPILPVPLIAEALLAGIEEDAEILKYAQTRVDLGSGANIYFPESGLEAGLEEALSGLAIRKVIGRKNGKVTINEPDVIEYYANSILHLKPVENFPV